MTESQVRDAVLKQFGLRIQPEMGQYVARQLGKTSNGSIAVIGGNARTGVAVRQLIAGSELMNALSSGDGSQAAI